ncbi:MAG TPA: hypothetical protein VGH00_00420 [Chthoniobacterales bacterium]
MNESHGQPVRFYFALPRLLLMLRGGDPARAEQSATEAWVAGIATYAISYLFFAGFVPDTFPWWLRVAAFLVLAFLVWLFWLLALYLNALILKFLRGLGLFRALAARRGQSILISTTVTAMALWLLPRGSLAGECGAIWLIAVTMNLSAALILAFHDGDRLRA